MISGLPTYFIRKIHTKYILTIILLTTRIISIHAQNIYKDFLSSSNSTKIFTLYDSLSSYYHSAPLHKPFINNVELRTETNMFRLDRQEYILRLTTDNPLNNLYQNKINEIEYKKNGLIKNTQQSERLYLKYKAICKFESLKSSIGLLKDQKTILEKLVLFLKDPVIHEDKASLDKYYESTLKLNKTDLDLYYAQFEYDQLHSEIFSGSNSNPLPSNFLNIPSMNKYIQNYDQPNGTMQEEIFQLDLSKSKLEFIQKKSNDHKLLEYFQVQYQSNPNDILKKNLSVGLALRIPYIIDNNYLKENYQLKLFNLKIDKTELEEKNNYRITSIKNKMDLLSHTFEFVQNQTNQFLIHNNIDSLLKIGFMDTRFILEMKLQVNKFKQQQAELESEAINLFIDFLYYTDHFYQNPNKYYLTIPFQEL